MLNCQNLNVTIGSSRILRDCSFAVGSGEVVCLVGESGCGKSMTALSIMGLLPESAHIDGTISYDGHSLLDLNEKEYSGFRGSSISMIFQEPMTSLNPVFRIGDQIAEPLILHRGMKKSDARSIVMSLLSEIGISPERIDDYPHQLSGGMRQRVMIAMAIACQPGLLIADEPTTALDVTIQGQILTLLRDLASEREMGILLITHDLAVVRETADFVNVMYAGEIIEQAPAASFFRFQAHPYARGLMQCLPRKHQKERLRVIGGVVPSPEDVPSGCSFAPRCAFRTERCTQQHPSLEEYAPSHYARCFNL